MQETAAARDFSPISICKKGLDPSTKHTSSAVTTAVAYRQKGRAMHATGRLTVVGPGWQTGFSKACRNISDGQSAMGRKTLNKIRP